MTFNLVKLRSITRFSLFLFTISTLFFTSCDIISQLSNKDEQNKTPAVKDGNTIEQAILLDTNGVAYSDTMDDSTDIDFFTFNTTSGNHYTISIESSDGDIVDFYLYNSEIIELNAGFVGCPILLNSADGNAYYLKVIPYESGVGEYSITIIECLPYTDGNDSAVDAIGLTVDAAATSDDLGAFDDIDYFSFTATAGSGYKIISTGAAGAIEIISPSGSSTWSVNSIIITNAEAGDYQVLVYANSGITGAYTIEVDIYKTYQFDFRSINPLNLTNTYDGSSINAWDGATLSIGVDGEIIATVSEAMGWGDFDGGFAVVEDFNTDLSSIDYIYFEIIATGGITDASLYEYQCQTAMIARIDEISYDDVSDISTTLACTVDIQSISSAMVPVSLLFPVGLPIGSTITFSKIAYLREDPSGTQVSAKEPDGTISNINVIATYP